MWSPPSVDQRLGCWSSKQAASVVDHKWVWPLSHKLHPPPLLPLLWPHPLAVAMTAPLVGGHQLIIAERGRSVPWPCWREGGDRSWQCGRCKLTGELQWREVMSCYTLKTKIVYRELQIFPTPEVAGIHREYHSNTKELEHVHFPPLKEPAIG